MCCLYKLQLQSFSEFWFWKTINVSDPQTVIYNKWGINHSKPVMCTQPNILSNFLIYFSLVYLINNIVATIWKFPLQIVKSMSIDLWKIFLKSARLGCLTQTFHTFVCLKLLLFDTDCICVFCLPVKILICFAVFSWNVTLSVLSITVSHYSEFCPRSISPARGSAGYRSCQPTSMTRREWQEN